MVILSQHTLAVSMFFLLLINILAAFIMVYYFIFNLKNSTNKYEYLKTHRVKTVLLSSFLLFSSYYLANSLFEGDPDFNYFFDEEKYSSSENNRKVSEIEEEVRREKQRALADSLTSVNEDHLFEKNILNLDSHFIFQKEHFKLPKMILDDHNRILFERDDYTSFNRYVDLTKSYEQNYIDVGYFGTALCLFYQQNYQAALDSITKIKNKKMDYVAYIKAQIHQNLGNIPQAITAFEDALQHTPQMEDTIHTQLVLLYKANQLNAKLLPYAENPALHHFLDHKTIRRVLLTNFKIIDYYTFVIRSDFARTNLTGVVAAICICLIWFIFLNNIDIFEKEKYINIIFCTILGGLFTFFTFMFTDFLEFISPLNENNLLAFFIIHVGLIEELVKIIPFLIILYFSKSIDEPFDYILYASLSALGFATVENMLYFDSSKVTVIFSRALLCASGHMTFSSIIAYGMVKAKLFAPKKMWLNFIFAWLIAAIIHGLYDFFLEIEFIIGAAFIFIGNVTIWFIFINNTLNFSPRFTYQTKVNIDHKIVFLGVGLTSILVFEFGVNIFRYNINIANRSLYYNLIFSAGLIIFMIYKISNLDLIHRYWRPIKLSSGKNMANPFNIFVLIMRFFMGNHIAAQNFVDKHIAITPYWNNKALIDLMPYSIEGVIRDRIIMTKNENGKSIDPDPSWFIVKMKKDLELQDFNTNYVLIKFRNDIESMKVDDDNTAMLSLINDFSLFNDNKIDWSNTTPFGYVTVAEIDNNEAILQRKA